MRLFPRGKIHIKRIVQPARLKNTSTRLIGEKFLGQSPKRSFKVIGPSAKCSFPPLMMTALKDAITSLDIFPKIDASYVDKTSGGGLFSMVVYGMLTILTASELYSYLWPAMRQDFIVDRTFGEQLEMDLDISVATPCDKLLVVVAEDKGKTILINNQLSAKDISFAEIKRDIK